MSFLDKSQSANPCISEPLFQKNAASFWRTVGFLEAVVFLFSILPTLFCVWADFLESISVAGIMGLALFPIILIIAYSHISYFHQKMGNVNFDGKNISVYDRMNLCAYTTKLADCRWLVNKRIFATIPPKDLEGIGIGIGEALLIVFPDSIKKVQYRTRSQSFEEPVIVAVGLTPETRGQWQQAIERLNVEEEKRTIRSFRGKVSFLPILH